MNNMQLSPVGTCISCGVHERVDRPLTRSEEHDLNIDRLQIVCQECKKM